MNTKFDLNDMTIWLARPKETGESLAAQLKQHGAKVLHIPSLHITSFGNPILLKSAFENIPSSSLLIFTSQYSVWFGAPYLSHLATQTPHIAIAAIGEKTALALKKLGLSPQFIPESQASSESLFQELESKLPLFENIYLIQGKTHRNFLKKTLENHGKNVKSILVYQQRLPKIDISEVQSYLNQKKLHALIAGSFLSVENCLRLVGSAFTQKLLEVPLFVISERIQTLAHQLGFQNVQLAPMSEMDDLLNLLHSQKEKLCKNLKP